MVEKETRKNNKGLDLERLYQETLPSFVLDYFHIFYELQEHSVEFPSPYILRNYYMNNVTIKLHYILHYAILECNMTSSASALVELPLFSTKREAAMSTIFCVLSTSYHCSSSSGFIAPSWILPKLLVLSLPYYLLK